MGEGQKQEQEQGDYTGCGRAKLEVNSFSVAEVGGKTSELATYTSMRSTINHGRALTPVAHN